MADDLNFHLQLGGKFVEIIQIFIITAAMMFQIQAVCWFGTQLTQQVCKQEGLNDHKTQWFSAVCPLPTTRHFILTLVPL